MHSLCQTIEFILLEFSCHFLPLLEHYIFKKGIILKLWFSFKIIIYLIPVFTLFCSKL